jgi:hypothetical protein
MFEFINRLYSRLFVKKKTDQEDNRKVTNTNLLDITISLTDTYEIDLSIVLYDSHDIAKHMPLEFSQKCAEFLNIINQGKLKKQMISLISDHIRDESNEDLKDNIFGFWSIIEKEEKKIKQEDSFIKPTQVFARYAINK